VEKLAGRAHPSKGGPVAGKSYAEQVLAFVAGYDHGMGALDDPAAGVLQHVTRHTPDGDVRTDGCPCPRGEETLPTDDAGRPVLELLGEGHYISSARHTFADLIRDVAKGA
jgi:hypothetical protein